MGQAAASRSLYILYTILPEPKDVILQLESIMAALKEISPCVRDTRLEPDDIIKSWELASSIHATLKEADTVQNDISPAGIRTRHIMASRLKNLPSQAEEFSGKVKGIVATAKEIQQEQLEAKRVMPGFKLDGQERPSLSSTGDAQQDNRAASLQAASQKLEAACARLEDTITFRQHSAKFPKGQGAFIDLKGSISQAAGILGGRTYG